MCLKNYYDAIDYSEIDKSILPVNSHYPEYDNRNHYGYQINGTFFIFIYCEIPYIITASHVLHYPNNTEINPNIRFYDLHYKNKILNFEIVYPGNPLHEVDDFSILKINTTDENHLSNLLSRSKFSIYSDKNKAEVICCGYPMNLTNNNDEQFIEHNKKGVYFTLKRVFGQFQSSSESISTVKLFDRYSPGGLSGGSVFSYNKSNLEFELLGVCIEGGSHSAPSCFLKYIDIDIIYEKFLSCI